MTAALSINKIKRFKIGAKESKPVAKKGDSDSHSDVDLQDDNSSSSSNSGISNVDFEEAQSEEEDGSEKGRSDTHLTAQNCLLPKRLCYLQLCRVILHMTNM